MFTWPAGLPAPLWDGYSVTSIDALEQTPTDDGKFRSRSRSKEAGPAVIDIAVALDAEQEILARSFHDFVLHNGADTFIMRLRSGGAMHAMQVQRFGPPPVYPPMGPNAVRMSFRVIVHRNFGSVLWCDTDLSRATYPLHTGSALNLGTIDDFKISRAYIFGRAAFNGGNDKFILGWAGDTNALIELTAFPAADGLTTITTSSPTKGIALGVGQSSEKTIKLRFQADAEPTTGQACVIVPYEDFAP